MCEVRDKLTAAMAMVCEGESITGAARKAGCDIRKLNVIAYASGQIKEVPGLYKPKTAAQAEKYEAAAKLLEDPLADPKAVSEATGFSLSTLYRMVRRQNGAMQTQVRTAARIEKVRQLRAEKPGISKAEVTRLTGWYRNTVAKYWDASQEVV